MKRLIAWAFSALPGCATPPTPAPERGTPLREYARVMIGRDTLEPADLVSALRDVARRHKDSPESLLRQTYFLLTLWPKDADWEIVRPALIRDGVSDARQWTAGNPEDRWYPIRFTAQPAAWVSPGGHTYDLAVEADVRFDVASGRQSRGTVRNPEASLRAQINLDRLLAVNSGGYAPDSIFRKVMESGPKGVGRRHLPFLTRVRAGYRVFHHRWVDLLPFVFELQAEFVDHPAGRFEIAHQQFTAVSELDPPIDHRDELRPGQDAFPILELLQERGTLGESFSPIGEGHALARIDARPRLLEDC